MRRSIFLFSVILPLLTIGCQRDDQIRTYRVSKETPSPMTMNQPPFQGMTNTAIPPKEIMWKLPSGWIEQAPSAMRVGSFLIKGSNGQSADMSIIPLSGMAGGDLANINRWRGQINLEPITEEALAQNSQIITPGGRKMLLVDFAHQNRRLLAAIYTQGERTWFFKMLGDDQTVKETKPTFMQFLKNLRFQNA